MAQMRETVSEIPERREISLLAHVGVFLKSGAWGALAGGVWFLPLTIVVGLKDLQAGEFLASLCAMAMPLLFSGVVTFAGMIVFGIPTMLYLRAKRLEEASIYAWFGALFSLLATLVLARFLNVPLDEAWILALPGLLAGVTAATLWGRWRERCAALSAEGEAPPERRSNPIHELIH